MRMETLYEFIMIARKLNFSKAAASLNLTQSTLSKHIAALERELGVVLVERGRQLALTRAGEQLLASAQRIVGVYEEEMAALRRASRKAGPVRMAFCGTSYEEAILAAVRDIPVQCVPYADDRDYLDLLDHDHADVALNFDFSSVPGLAQEAQERGVRCLPLGAQPAVLIMGADHPLAAHPALSREDLRDQEMLIVGRGPFDDFSRCIAHHFGEDLRLRFRLMPIGGMYRNIGVADFGSGILFLTSSLASLSGGEGSGHVAFTELGGEPLGVPIALTYRKDEDNPDVLAFIDQVVDLLAPPERSSSDE